jgi:hypothetical protein
MQRSDLLSLSFKGCVLLLYFPIIPLSLPYPSLPPSLPLSLSHTHTHTHTNISMQVKCCMFGREMNANGFSKYRREPLVKKIV